MLHHKYIAIEGPIGVGKTSLAEILAKKLNSRLVAEGAVYNPFIHTFYKDIKAHAFQTQLFFLLSRYKQQQELAQSDLFQRGTVSDYIFAKDRLFANLVLDDILKPDFVIYLQASTDVLLKRIALRGRKFESQINEAYLAELNQAYNYFFFHYQETPLMVVNTSGIDFVHRDADLGDLLTHMGKIIKGTVYYQPVSLKK
jgi:deoxyadenosine/deoxycytidine kinase